MKQLVNKFTGQVNDKIFNTKEEMVKYIEYCIENGIDIEYSSSHTCSRYVDVDETRNCCNDERPIELPEPYTSLSDYLAPEMNEEGFTGSVEDGKIIKDANDKLQKRLEFYNSNYSKSAYISDEKFRVDLEPVVSDLTERIMKCSENIQNYKGRIDSAKTRISRLKAEINQLYMNISKYENLITVNDSYGGYCSCLSDTIMEDTRFNNSEN